MNEINVNHTNKGELTMKKTVLIVAFAMTLLLALAAPAFAKYAGYSSSTQYVPWATAQNLASQNVDAAVMASGPHAGYATTTIKCAVCHSVHRAGTKLLNEGAACAYCHTTVAHGGGAVATNLVSWDTANGGPHGSRCANDDCHGGVHGVGASTYDGPASKLLTAKMDTKLDTLVAANGLATSVLDTYNAQTEALATAATCSRSGCHTNSMFGVVTSGAMDDVSVGTTQSVTGHRVIAAATDKGWNLDGSMGSTKTGLTIAYKPVNGCSSCHDLTDDNNAGKAAFPHAINDVVSVAQGKTVASPRTGVWLTAAPDAATQSLAVGAYSASSATSTPNAVAGAAGSTIIDGVCLKCHRGTATTGLGFGY